MPWNVAPPSVHTRCESLFFGDEREQRTQLGALSGVQAGAYRVVVVAGDLPDFP
jgi:hypothetical protein